MPVVRSAFFLLVWHSRHTRRPGLGKRQRQTVHNPFRAASARYFLNRCALVMLRFSCIPLPRMPRPPEREQARKYDGHTYRLGIKFGGERYSASCCG
jgi:hypothetical protein